MNDQHYQNLFNKLINMSEDKWDKMDKILSEISELPGNIALSDDLFLDKWEPIHLSHKDIYALNRKPAYNLIYISRKYHSTIFDGNDLSAYFNSNDNKINKNVLQHHIFCKNEEIKPHCILRDASENLDYKPSRHSDNYAIAA